MTDPNTTDTKSRLAYDFCAYSVSVDGRFTHAGVAEIFLPGDTPSMPRHAPAMDRYDRDGRPVHDGPAARPLFTL